MWFPNAIAAGAAEHDLVLLHRVAEPAGRLRERVLERRVRERLDAAAVVADEVVMVIVVTAERLEAGDPVADVDALHQVESGEGVEGPVDARDADGAAPGDDSVVDLLGGAAAVLARQEVDDRTACPAAPQARVAEGAQRPLGPPHALNDTDSHSLLASPGACFREPFSCAWSA